MMNIPPPKLRPITSVQEPHAVSDMNRNNQEVGFFSEFYNGADEPLDINLANLKNLESLSLMPVVDNFNISVSSIPPALENNENTYFQDSFDAPCAPPFFDDPKEGNISKTVRVPSSEHVAEIVGRQGCKIKDLRARTNTYIKTPMRTQSPVFVVTGKEEAVLHVMDEINNAAEHFTHIRASRNHHKTGGLETAKPVSREGDIVLYVTVPYRVVGLVVGLKGQTIKTIQQDTDTFIVTPNRDKAPIFEIRGQPESVERAKMMILRHIETRTRHCRLQDTTNLPPANWNDEQRFNSNDITSYYSSEIPSQNGLPANGYQGTNGVLNGSPLNPHQGSVGSSSSQTSSSSYNSWRGYSSLVDQQPAPPAHMATWSSATSDYPSAGGLGSSVNAATLNGLSSLSISKSSNPLSNAVRSSNSSFNYGITNGSGSVSNGSISSPSSSDDSISPPNEFMNDPQFGSGHLSSPYNSCNPMNNPFMKRINEAHAQEPNPFQSFLNTSQTTPTSDTTTTKNSLMLGNLFQPANSTTSTLGMNGLMTSSNVVNNNNANHNISSSNSSLGMFSCIGNDAALLSSSTGSQGGAALRQAAMTSQASRLFPGQLLGDIMGPLPASGESSPTSKMSDSSGSQGSPVPRMCKVCDVKEVDSVALVPCGEKKFCRECAEDIVKKAKEGDSQCPVCKDTVTDMLEIKS